MNAPMTTAQLAELVLRHMAKHGLPEPASLHLSMATLDQHEVRVQLRSVSSTDTAAGLLAWANTQAAVRLEAWRPPSGDRVHLDLHTALTGEHGTAELLVFGGVDIDSAVFPALQPGEHRPVSLGQLIAWAADRTEVAA